MNTADEVNRAADSFSLVNTSVWPNSPAIVGARSLIVAAILVGWLLWGTAGDGTA